MAGSLPQTTAEALEYEADIAVRAREIWQARSDKRWAMPADLFLELWPLLCEPIPPAYIKTVGAVKGKPYPSTGIKSVQVQIDRMNNVLSPLCWWYTQEHSLEGKLCTVTVCVGDLVIWEYERRRRLQEKGEAGRLGEAFSVQKSFPGILVSRSSTGGVGQGSTVGNVYKGSFTNAAKPAFARVGPGHEIYIGATDLDPDVSAEVAGATSDEPATDGMINAKLAKEIVNHAWLAGEKDRLRLAASKLANRDVGDCSTKTKAADALTGAFTFEQAEQLDSWLSAQADRQANG